MRFDPDKIRRTYAYIFSCLPLIIGFTVLIASHDLYYYHLICLIVSCFLSFKLVTATYKIFSFSLIVNDRFIYLTSEEKNARLIWDNIKEIYLGRYTYLNIQWLFFINKHKKTGSDLAFRLSVLSETDQKKLLNHIKLLAKKKSVPINY